MTSDWQDSLKEARLLVRRLRDTGKVEAPPRLRGAILVAAHLEDAFASFDTPIGPVCVAYNKHGISAVSRGNDPLVFQYAFQERFARPVHAVTHLPPSIRDAVLSEWTGDVQQPPLQLDLRGLSEFERAVLLKTREIPRGEVRPYAWIAHEIGRPRAARAVGSALAENPIPLLIPCHRVVRSDGHLGNYVFGPEIKRSVLRTEGAAPDILESLAEQGVRYLGDPDGGYFCFPSCGSIHRHHNSKLLPFHSSDDALAAGLRPCRTCRPLIN